MDYVSFSPKSIGYSFYRNITTPGADITKVSQASGEGMACTPFFAYQEVGHFIMRDRPRQEHHDARLARRKPVH